MIRCTEADGDGDGDGNGAYPSTCCVSDNPRDGLSHGTRHGAWPWVPRSLLPPNAANLKVPRYLC